MAKKAGEPLQKSSYEVRARLIIEGNMYMVIGTADKDNAPWSAPTFFAYDKNYDFYFLSAVDSRHVENIMENPKVSIVIYDSTQPLGDYEGVQAEGMVSKVEGVHLKQAITLYANRLTEKGLFKETNVVPTERYPPENYSGVAEFGFFKITVSRLFVTSEDRRTEVSIKEM